MCLQWSQQRGFHYLESTNNRRVRSSFSRIVLTEATRQVVLVSFVEVVVGWMLVVRVRVAAGTVRLSGRPQKRVPAARNHTQLTAGGVAGEDGKLTPPPILISPPTRRPGNYLSIYLPVYLPVYIFTYYFSYFKSLHYNIYFILFYFLLLCVFSVFYLS